jgi:hypothetical protein
LLLPVTTERRTRQQSNVLKCAVALVVVDVVGASIVGDVQVWPAIIVVVGPNALHPEVMIRIVYSGFL